ncbi:MAG: histone deacetylase family protein [Chloroflexi bacterium HGW-Chloroflexi-3]|nr:MAG: histone deacetylase family protein [Chloroflexi bacterium HGW-Chloroflexi-3]
MTHRFFRIPIFYSADHNLHQPQFEYDRGVQISYQEQARRIESVREALLQLTFTQEFQPDPALTVEQIARVHTTTLIEHLRERSEFARQQEQVMGQDDLYLYPWIYPLNQQMREGLLKSPDSAGCYAFDTYAPIGKNTWQAVYASANLAYCAALSVSRLEWRVAYALCRPPGHHAGNEMIGGYCYLNNAAIAADQLNQVLGRGAILDIDYHHGNGTQEIFWNDPNILFVSIHADPAEEYPFFSGFAEERGGEQAYEANLNLPLPKECDDQTYLHALSQALDAIKGFQPNWLVLSAGYDTCQADPSTFFNLTDDVYSEIGKRIGSLNLPTEIVHEGGYAIEHNGLLSARLLSGIIDSST